MQIRNLSFKNYHFGFWTPEKARFWFLIKKPTKKICFLPVLAFIQLDKQ